MRLNILSLTFALLLAVGLSFGVGAGPIVDGDSDGVIDELDNCSTVVNPNQCDLDMDGYGSACDIDYTQDMVGSIADFVTFQTWFTASPTSPPEQGADQDCDGVIGISDFVTFQNQFTTAPGPSGLLCAGVIACGGV